MIWYTRQSNGGHGHGITTHHPYFVGYYISFENGAEPVQGSDEPPAGHEHEEGPFPKTAFCEKWHVQAGRGAQEQDDENIDLTWDTMYGFRLFKDITGELDKGRTDAEGAGSDMDIETGIIKVAFEKQFSFFDKRKIPFKAEVWDSIINKEQAESSHRYPEQHLK